MSFDALFGVELDLTRSMQPFSPIFSLIIIIILFLLSTLALESIISHPDEMEHLEQYRVLSNYERKDSHQVSLMANQLVHVIEKHDTGEICIYVCN